MNKFNLRSSCLALAVVALGAAAPAGATVLLVTDASWLATKADPGAGWNLAGFDDSSWEQAVILPAFGPQYAGSQVIWAPCDHPDQWANGTPNPGAGCQYSFDREVWFRTTFELAAMPLGATLQLGVDDDATIFINGQSVFSNADCQAGNAGPFDITSYLTAGINQVAVSATDCNVEWGGPGNGNHGFVMAVQGEVPDRVDVPEPMSALLVLGGAAGLVAARRRIRKA